MLTALTVSGVIAAYLLMVCMVAALTIKIDPFGVDDERPVVWVISTAWPVSVPILVVMGIITRLLGPGMAWIADRMVALVDWMTTERPKKIDLPKAQVHK